jgi:hypothetical protein
VADIRCSNCKKNNPDFLDVCQFCQTPLKPESMVHIGERPIKKDTGELEPILPEWLRDVRQQSRDAAAEDAATQSSVQKNEPPDFLAGLTSQTNRAADDEVPGWLANLNPVAKEKPPLPSSPEPETDFFAQFNKSIAEPPPAAAQEPGQSKLPPQPPAERDELSDWFSQASEQPAKPVAGEPAASHTDMGWMDNFDSLAESAAEPAPKEEEDLSWLHDLEASAKGTEDLTKPQQDSGWMPDLQTPSGPAQPSAPQEDLSWLNDLGGISAPGQAWDNAQNKSSAPKDDLGWLNNVGGTAEPVTPAQPPSAGEDLGWLDNLGGTSDSEPVQSVDSTQDRATTSKEDASWLDTLGSSSEPIQPAPPKEDLGWMNSPGGTQEPSAPAASQPAAPQEDLSWLDNLGRTPEPAAFDQPQDLHTTAQDDMSWLDKLGSTEGPSIPAPASSPSAQDEPDWLKSLSGQTEETPAAADVFSPRHTAPLPGEIEAPMPDWLKSATEEPSMPMGVEALDRFRDTFEPPPTQQSFDDSLDWMKPAQESERESEPLPSAPLPATIDSSLFAPSDSSLSNQDVDSLLSMEMPDWLARPEPTPSETSTQEPAIRAPQADAELAPVELPSWVQAMRPVEAVVSETTPSMEDQPTEREGPLAGLRGLIPVAPIGSARRPKPISLKLQATDEQQASAALLEQILGTEINPRAVTPPAVVMSQQALRWALSGMLLLVLGVMISLRTQAMRVSAQLPVGVDLVSGTIAKIPENSQVLVVVDYEPSLAGEIEAASGPVLDQIVLTRHPRLSFLSTSPNGSALAERLMTNTNINQPSPNGLGYNAGEHYFNLGYLPGGAAGVLEFVEAPQVAMPSSGVSRLSDFSAVIVLTDHAESARVWVEQLRAAKQADSALNSQPLLVVSSAQAAPLLQPYVSSRQITGMVSGLSEGAGFEFVNNSRPGIARAYWDSFGVGLMFAIVAITLGSLWSLFSALRARRLETEQG